LAAGGDPGQEKQEKNMRAMAVSNSFERLALEWHEHKSMNWSAGYARDILEYLRKDIFPYIGSRSITDIKPVDMLAFCARWNNGVLDKLKKHVRPAGRSLPMLSLPVEPSITRGRSRWYAKSTKAKTLPSFIG
jgi:hypothetical protein